jgi:RNA polymerase sigma-70 factor (ECF subfamily)
VPVREGECFDDLVQEAFSRAWERWDRIAGYEDPVGWVRRVAWNLAVSRWRRMRTVTTFLRRQPSVAVAGPGPDRVVLVEALSKIPADQRRVLVLYHMADMSVPEIATQCGVAEGTVRSWLHRGRQALAAQLDPSVHEEGAR